MLFETGQVICTQGVAHFFAEHKLELSKYLNRHCKGDWGDLDKEDKALNQSALKRRGRLFSKYDLPAPFNKEEPAIYIITEADRSATTILFPHEY